MFAGTIAVLSIVCCLFGGAPVVAQEEKPPHFPDWVTNDYDCVIGCLQIFNETITARPSSETELQGNQCVLDKCNKDTMSMNIYQANYIIQMFYDTGSIYEAADMGQWANVTSGAANSAPPETEEEGVQQSSSISSSSESSTMSTSASITSISASATSSLSTAQSSSSGTSGFGQDLQSKSGAGVTVTVGEWSGMFVALAVAGISGAAILF